MGSYLLINVKKVLYIAELPEKLTIIGGMFFISSIFYLIFGNGYYNGF
jgi:hypothetical protein